MRGRHEGTGPFKDCQRLHKGAALEGVESRLVEALRRLLNSSPFFQVLRDHDFNLRPARPAMENQPVCDAFVQFLALAQQHRLIRRVAHQGVLEQHFLRLRIRRGPVVVDHFLHLQARQSHPDVAEQDLIDLAARCLAAQVGHRQIPENPTHHRGTLQHVAFVRWQTVQTRLQHGR